MKKPIAKTRKKSKKKLILPVWRKHFKVLVIGAVLVIGGTYLGVWKIQKNAAVSKERAAYETADQSMQQLYNGIVKVVGHLFYCQTIVFT